MRKENLKKITELRHELHREPELSMQEERTMARLVTFLQDNTDLEIVRRTGWLYAVKAGRPGGRRIAFRADMDALPIQETLPLPYASCRAGISHKCGHDGHCAALCGLALELSRAETADTVYLIFQPGEETGEGAKRCCGLIRQEGIEEIYAFHNLPGYPEGKLVYREGLTQPASEGLRIRLEGKTSHASAPEASRNPAQALSRITLYSQTLSRQPSEAMRLCTVTGLNVGSGDFGISPGLGELSLTLRAEREEEMNGMEAALLSCAAKEAEEGGFVLTHEIRDRFPETRNHAACLARVIRAAEKLGIPAAPMESLWRASEDFGQYLKECPGAMFYLGAGEKNPALHTDTYDFNDGLLETAVDLFTALATNRRWCFQKRQSDLSRNILMIL